MKNAIHQLEINELLLLSAFQQSLWQKLVFVLTQENGFCRGFILKPTERAQVLLK